MVAALIILFKYPGECPAFASDSAKPFKSCLVMLDSGLPAKGPAQKFFT
jgi:hypothetical protein